MPTENPLSKPAVEHQETKSLSSSDFVKRYVGIISIVSFVLIITIFGGFQARTQKLLKDRLLHEARAFFQEIVQTRHWIIKENGVYVKKSPGMWINPSLADIKGLKTSITDSDGNTYLLRSHAAITRKISQLGQEERLFEINITSLNPLSQLNTPDSFEKTALTIFERGPAEFYRFEKTPSGQMFRYMAPLHTEQSCIDCHVGYEVGDIRGGISISIPAENLKHEITETLIYTVVSAIALLTLLLSVIIYIAQRFIRDLKKSEEKLYQLATTDSLTGLLNRGEGIRRFQQEISRSLRRHQALSILLLDIDYFKKINDNFGHQVGDVVIQQVSDILVSILRNYDIVCRYGGEEFLVVLPTTDLQKAVETAERIRKMIEAMEMTEDEHGAIFRLTVSLGVSALKSGDSLDGLIYRADNALYIAKQEGRNQVHYIE
ncbi:MAG: diguanylate cyclase [Proteobacteria bacterium]|nr:diguanylate cyclase [Pseudomonadota bacterium]MBU1737549.1 diguanylate cyclase [Pseudomonadota bacterium]